MAGRQGVSGDTGESDDRSIIVRGIGQTFRRRRTSGSVPAEFTALSDVNLKVRRGEFLAIVGPSGCGKSTLLDILAGLARPSSGEIHIDGKKITGPDLDRGIVLQGYALFPWRTVRQNVEFGLEIKKVPRGERKAISDRFITLVNLN